MSNKTVLIDVQNAGASGDMFLSALIDLIGENESIVPVAASLLLYDPAIRVKVVQKETASGTGKKLEITKDESLRFSPSSLLEIIQSTTEELELSKNGAELCKNALNELLQAEVRAHDTPLEKLHLHETGSIDTVLDIVGTVYLLEKTGLLDNKIISTKVAVGKGTIQTEHGELEVPVPAVAEIIVHHEVPYHTGDANTELLTPTGAALLVALAEEFIESTEGFVTEKHGAGFGTRDLGVIPNMLKISVGTFDVDKPAPGSLGKPKKFKKPKKTEFEKKSKSIAERKETLGEWNADEVVVIEANIDDVDGEVLGNMFDILLAEGLAYDVVMIPAYGKKNRPCFVVKVVAPKPGLKSIAELMIKHLGTLGIRYQEWSRLKAARETIVCRLEVDNQEFMVRVKVARGADGSIVNIKPEADDLMKVSHATGIPIRDLKPRVVLQAHAITE